MPEAAAINGVVATDGDHHGICAEERGHNHAYQVSSEEPDASVRVHSQHKGPVAVTVGGNHRPYRTAGTHDFGGVVLDSRELRRLYVFRIYGNEGLTASHGNHVGAQGREDFYQKIPPHGRMLVHNDALAAQTGAAKEAGIPAKVRLPGIVRGRRQGGMTGFEHPTLIE